MAHTFRSQGNEAIAFVSNDEDNLDFSFFRRYIALIDHFLVNETICFS